MNYNTIPAKELRWMASHNCEHGHKYIEHPQCYKKFVESGVPAEKIGFFDIETSNLSANFGLILSYAIKERGGKVVGRVITPKELSSCTQDKEIVRECIAELEKFDRVVGFYSRKFDLPYVRTRALANDLEFPGYGAFKHTDVYYWAKFKLKLNSNRLGTVAPFLGIAAKDHPLHGGIWSRALAGHGPSLKWILTHNIEDVKSTEELFEKLLPYNRLTNTVI